MAARLSAAVARRERTAAEAAAKEGRRAAVEEVRQRNGASAAGVRAAKEEAQRLAGLEVRRSALSSCTYTCASVPHREVRLSLYAETLTCDMCIHG